MSASRPTTTATPPPQRSSSVASSSSNTSLSVAIVLRGAAYRFGCDAIGVAFQDNVLHSLTVNISKPLERLGHRVEFFMPLDGKSCADEELWHRLLHRRGIHVRASAMALWRAQGNNQGGGVKAALDLFAPFAGAYDLMVLARYDTQIMMPVDHWTCNILDSGGKIGLAAPCEDAAWQQWNCTNDMLWVVPRVKLESFIATVGVQKGPMRRLPIWYMDQRTGRKVWARGIVDACFDAINVSKPNRTMFKMPQGYGSGHGCYNRLVRRIGLGRLQFCWANPAGKRVLEGSEYFRLPARDRRGPGALAAYVRKLGLLSLDEAVLAASARVLTHDVGGQSSALRVTNRTSIRSREVVATVASWVRKHAA